VVRVTNLAANVNTGINGALLEHRSASWGFVLERGELGDGKDCGTIGINRVTADASELFAYVRLGTATARDGLVLDEDRLSSDRIEIRSGDEEPFALASPSFVVVLVLLCPFDADSLLVSLDSLGLEGLESIGYVDGLDARNEPVALIMATEELFDSSLPAHLGGRADLKEQVAKLRLVVYHGELVVLAILRDVENEGLLTFDSANVDAHASEAHATSVGDFANDDRRAHLLESALYRKCVYGHTAHLLELN
jgi:hypothetical protein